MIAKAIENSRIATGASAAWYECWAGSEAC